MKKSAIVLLVLAFLLVVSGPVAWWRSYRRAQSHDELAPPRPAPRDNGLIVVPPPLAPRAPITGLSAEEKAARI